MDELNLKVEQTIENVEDFKFEPIKGQPMLNWRGKRPFTSTQFYPAQLKETFGEEVNGWMNKIFWGDNLQVMSHLLKKYRGQVDLIYIDPPYNKPNAKDWKYNCNYVDGNDRYRHSKWLSFIEKRLKFRELI